MDLRDWKIWCVSGVLADYITSPNYNWLGGKGKNGTGRDRMYWSLTVSDPRPPSSIRRFTVSPKRNWLSDLWITGGSVERLSYSSSYATARPKFFRHAQQDSRRMITSSGIGFLLVTLSGRAKGLSSTVRPFYLASVIRNAS
jgi:hypothetical protein